jgi:hypothetical protein
MCSYSTGNCLESVVTGGLGLDMLDGVYEVRTEKKVVEADFFV